MIEIFTNSRWPIHHRYAMLVEKIDRHKPVLKTDLWNEINTQYPIQADLYAEIDPVLVQ